MRPPVLTRPQSLGQFAVVPPEVVAAISSLLPNRDVKSLRLACRHLHGLVNLRFDRVFLSPNPRNVDVCNAIAAHETFRQNITEIVYDDARLTASFESEDDGFSDLDDQEPLSDVPTEYLRTYNNILASLKRYGRGDVQRPDHSEVAKRLESMLGPKESYQLYSQLVKEQQTIIESGADQKALEYALTRFPRLRTITLTPSAHGEPMFPLYQTPMIRELPPGFIYPIPHSWPMPMRNFPEQPPLEPWSGDSVKSQWRGFCLLTRTLAACPSAIISDFIVDTSQLLTGLNCRLFDDSSNEEYKNLLDIFRWPTISRIDLALAVHGQDDENWPQSRSDHLSSALSKAASLKHVSVSTNIDVDTGGYISSGKEENFIPLRTLFPCDAWTRLQHFGLSRFYVKQADLFSLISALSPTLRSMELSFLAFIESHGNYRDLLRDMQQRLGWGERAAAQRPMVTVRVDPEFGPGAQIYIDVTNEVQDFLYNGRDNPFLEDESDASAGNRIPTGTGFERHVCNPALDRPNMDPYQLMTLGIVEKDEFYHRGMR